jgi:hypothetical protein
VLSTGSNTPGDTPRGKGDKAMLLIMGVIWIISMAAGVVLALAAASS